MLTGVKDIDTIILNNLEDKDLVMVCQVNKYVDRLCKDQTFWLNRILSKFPYLSFDILNKYKKNRSWSEYYINDLRKINPEYANYHLVDGSRNGRLDSVITALKMGANIHAWADEAIRLAGERGYLEVVKYLVGMGANIHAWDDFALKWAIKNKHIEVVNYLKSLP